MTIKYAIRLYEILISWREVGKTPVVTIADFREKIGLDDSEYQRMDNLKRLSLSLRSSKLIYTLTFKLNMSNLKLVDQLQASNLSLKLNRLRM